MSLIGTDFTRQTLDELPERQFRAELVFCRSLFLYFVIEKSTQFPGLSPVELGGQERKLAESFRDVLSETLTGIKEPSAAGDRIVDGLLERDQMRYAVRCLLL